MAGLGKGATYTTEYRRQCFDAWFLAGRPVQLARIREVIPVNEITNRKPSREMIRRWIMEDGWDVRADELDAKAMILVDDNLISKKAEIIKRHQENAAVLAKKAHEFLMSSDGFDSSSAAVNAYFRATEEERKMASFSDLLEKLGPMKDDDLMKEIINRINRGAENDQIVDGEEVKPDEESDEEE